MGGAGDMRKPGGMRHSAPSQNRILGKVVRLGFGALQVLGDEDLDQRLAGDPEAPCFAVQ